MFIPNIFSFKFLTLLKMRSSGNPKSGIPVTGQIKLPLDGHSNSSGK